MAAKAIGPGDGVATERPLYCGFLLASRVTNEIDVLKAELAALRQDLEDLRLAFPDALLEGDLATERVTFMNRLACLVFRCSPGDVATMMARDIFADGDYQRAQVEMSERLKQGFAACGGKQYVRSNAQDLREFTMRRKDGALFPAEIHSSLIRLLTQRSG